MELELEEEDFFEELLDVEDFFVEPEVFFPFLSFLVELLEDLEFLSFFEFLEFLLLLLLLEDLSLFVDFLLELSLLVDLLFFEVEFLSLFLLFLDEPLSEDFPFVEDPLSEDFPLLLFEPLSEVLPFEELFSVVAVVEVFFLAASDATGYVTPKATIIAMTMHIYFFSFMLAKLVKIFYYQIRFNLPKLIVVLLQLYLLQIVMFFWIANFSLWFTKLF